MLKVFDIREKKEYLKEVITLEHDQWASSPEEDRENRINVKTEKALSMLERNDFCKLVLLKVNKLVGFISIFPEDGVENENLTPWYATMYVKEEYRGKGYSKILNDAVLSEAKSRGYKAIYLKTTLENYYEKFGAVYIKNITGAEKLMKFDLR